MKILPCENRLYVKLDAVEERKSSGGIYMPGKHNELSRRGLVVAVGDKVKIPVGARVLVTSQAGIVVDDPELWSVAEGQDVHRIITSSEIMGVLEE